MPRWARASRSTAASARWSNHWILAEAKICCKAFTARRASSPTFMRSRRAHESHRVVDLCGGRGA